MHVKLAGKKARRNRNERKPERIETAICINGVNFRQLSYCIVLCGRVHFRG